MRPSWIRKLQQKQEQKQEGTQPKSQKGNEGKQENKEKGRQEVKKKATVVKSKPASAKDTGAKKVTVTNVKEEVEEKERVPEEKAVDGETKV